MNMQQCSYGDIVALHTFVLLCSTSFSAGILTHFSPHIFNKSKQTLPVLVNFILLLLKVHYSEPQKKVLKLAVSQMTGRGQEFLMFLHCAYIKLCHLLQILFRLKKTLQSYCTFLEFFHIK